MCVCVKHRGCDSAAHIIRFPPQHFFFFFKSLPPQVIYLDQISFIDRTAIDGRQAFCSTLNSTGAEQWKLEISNKYIYLYIYVHVCTFAVEEG